jgi:SAM-dependent methyltransferase
MHPAWNNVDFSPYARLRHHMGIASVLRRIGLISEPRFAQFSLVAPDVIAWNLMRGIPFADGASDTVYHSHLLEHFDRDDALNLLIECRRVLKPGGLIRVVVPDLETWVDAYRQSASNAIAGGGISGHEQVIDDLFGQFVQRQPPTRRSQKPLVRWLERLILGDSASTGWTHRWMYDRFTLPALLVRAGFDEVRIMSASDSRIEGWTAFGLEIDPAGSEYMPGSLRIEAVRPRCA